MLPFITDLLTDFISKSRKTETKLIFFLLWRNGTKLRPRTPACDAPDFSTRFSRDEIEEKKMFPLEMAFSRKSCHLEIDASPRWGSFYYVSSSQLPDLKLWLRPLSRFRGEILNLYEGIISLQCIFHSFSTFVRLHVDLLPHPLSELFSLMCLFWPSSDPRHLRRIRQPNAASIFPALLEMHGNSASAKSEK